MSWISNLRTAAMLRRVAKALEAGNELARTRLSLDHPEWGRREGLRRSPKVVEISVASVAEWNANWRKAHPPEEPDVS